MCIDFVCFVARWREDTSTQPTAQPLTHRQERRPTIPEPAPPLLRKTPAVWSTTGGTWTGNYPTTCATLLCRCAIMSVLPWKRGLIVDWAMQRFGITTYLPPHFSPCAKQLYSNTPMHRTELRIATSGNTAAAPPPATLPHTSCTTCAGCSACKNGDRHGLDSSTA